MTFSATNSTQILIRRRFLFLLETYLPISLYYTNTIFTYQADSSKFFLYYKTQLVEMLFTILEHSTIKNHLCHFVFSEGGSRLRKLQETLKHGTC